MKHLTKTLAAVSLLLPMSAQPLGIGELELHSALNQTLNAQIRLQLAPGENPDDIKVRLAPPEKFDQAGVPWSYFLSKIKFQTIAQTNGSVVIKVTSREPLTEPFLNFLLEVNWPQGSQFREFTALIDPPAEYRAPAIPKASAFNRYQSEPYQEYEQPVRKSRSTKKRAILNEQASSNITPQTPSSGEYGPVQANVTLWRIADELGNERNIATKQMLAALYQANPDAFNNGDIDSLKVGAILKIPETDVILQSGGKRTEPKSVHKNKASVTKNTNTASKALELVAPSAETKTASNTKIDGHIKPGQENTETNDNTGSSNSSADGKDLELQSRIDRLEKQLNMMQELLALKDQQLAKLQSNEKETVPATTEKPKVEPPVLSAPPTEQKTAIEPQPSVSKPTNVAQPPVAAPEPVKPAGVPVKPKPAKPKVIQPVEPDEDFFSSALYNLSVGSAGVGLIGLLGWLLWRKRKVESKTNTESMFASASQIKMPDGDSNLSLPVMEMSSTGAYDVGTVGESSFISDFTPSDFEAFDTDQSEIDPLSEADVYLAYGRYQQAEELIRQAIKEHPGRDEYKLKLLEIYYANENKEQFNDYAHELASSGKNNDASFWNKVSDMGKEIIPESVLFGGTATTFRDKLTEPVSVTEESTHLANFDSDDDLTLEFDSSNSDFIDLSDPTITTQGLTDEITLESDWQLNSSETDDNGLDFDLSLLSESKASPKPVDQINTLSNIESIDFNLSKQDEESVVMEESNSSDAFDSLESFDFNFDLGTTGTKDSEKKLNEDDALDIASLENFEFPVFEDSISLEEPTQTKNSTEIDSQDISDDFDFNFNFDVPSSLSSLEEIDLGVSDLTDMDEFETKIDLAKAYIDMGDSLKARTIAEEVLEKGNAEQKKSAQSLLNELI